MTNGTFEDRLVGMRDQFQRGFRQLIIATVTLYVLLLGLTIFMFTSASAQRTAIDSQTRRATSAICALRGDLQQRVATSEAWLQDNPNGVDGISADMVRQQIDGQKRTIDALNVVHCQEDDVTR